MSSRQEQKQRLREQRLARQAQEESAARRRLILGYVLAGVLTAAVVAGLVAVIIAGAGGDGAAEGSEAAFIDPRTGIFEDLEPDEREGTEPPAIKLGDLQASAQAAGCVLRERLQDEGNAHLRPDQPAPKYRTNPPTSGDHDPNPTADGAYLTTPEPRNAVHSLEHGRIEIQYSPDLPEEQQLALKGLVADDPDQMLMFPNPDLPYQVAASAWQAFVGCPQYSEGVLDVIRNFRDTYRGNGPEAVP
jgi:Protein of unknown function (DUF3105)